MGFEDAEGAELAAFVHDGLDHRDAFELLDGELVHRFDELVLRDVAKTALAVLAQAAVLTEHASMHQTLQHTVREAGVTHVVQTWEHVHFLELALIRHHLTGAWSRARANKAQIALQLKVVLIGPQLARRSGVFPVCAGLVLARRVDQLLNFFVRDDIVPPTGRPIHIISRFNIASRLLLCCFLGSLLLSYN